MLTQAAVLQPATVA
jgi:hypothetical protein